MVGASVKVSVFASRTPTPSIIYHNFLFHWTIVVQPSNEISWIPVFIIRFPIPVGPDDAGFIFVYLKNLFIINWLQPATFSREIFTIS